MDKNINKSQVDERNKEEYNREGGWVLGLLGGSEKVTLSQKPEGSEGCLEEECSRQGTSTCKGPGVGACLGC